MKNVQKKIDWDLSQPNQTNYFIYVEDNNEIYFDFNLFLENETNFLISQERYWETPENSDCYNFEWGVYSCRRIYLYPEEYDEITFEKALSASEIGTVVGISTDSKNLDKIISILS